MNRYTTAICVIQNIAKPAHKPTHKNIDRYTNVKVINQQDRHPCVYKQN